MLSYLFINALFIFGLRFAFENGNVLGFIPKWWLTVLGKYQIGPLLAKPLFFCLPCMASFWGWFGFQGTDIHWLFYPVWVIMLAGLNSIISKLIN